MAALIAHYLRLGVHLPIMLTAAATGDHPLEAHQQLLPPSARVVPAYKKSVLDIQTGQVFRVNG